MNRWILGLLMLVIVIFGMVFIAISEIQSNAAHPNPFNYGTCPNSQFATAVTTSTLNCALPPAQTNEYYGSCPLGQYATAITTTTLNCTTVQTQTSQFFSYGTCPVNQYATAVTTTTLNCASASNSNYLTTQTSAFFSYGSCGASKYVTAVTTTTLNCGVLPATQLSTLPANPNPKATKVTYPNFANMGLGAANQTVPWSYDPSVSGKVYVTMSFLGADSNFTAQMFFQMCYGTGTAPYNGALNQGTVFGSYVNLNALVANDGEWVVFSGTLSLSVGTTYWFDLQVESYSSNLYTVTVNNLFLNVIEFPS